ncbi:MAG: hypothetical protein OXL97_00470 [Chloroflexota bacterium]|nr:hypothetical protein [Chloroflexota bacterium]MDE2886498.1 hypothetical protein [Chloroflexota bacterium]
MTRCLVGVAISLLIVGVLSGTFARHVVQVIPVLLALGLVLQRPAVGAYVAIGVFTLWTFVMVLVWLYLLGLSDIADGSYTAGEVVLTIVIAACPAWGIRKALGEEHTALPFGRLRLALFGFALQTAVLLASFRLVA